MRDVDLLNKAIELYFEEHPDAVNVKPKDLMENCIKIGLFQKDNRQGRPVRDILRELDKQEKLYLIPTLSVERKEKNTYWYFNK